jgi:hypothetical protein
MSNPQRFINRAIVFLVLVGIVAAALWELIGRAFLYNPWLNGLIMAVLVLGIAYNIRRAARLKPETRWIEAYRTAAPGFAMMEAPRLLTPIAAALGERERQQRRGRSALSAVSLRYLLDSVSARLDESRDIAGYLRNLLIFLGLLGTFWGLIEAIGAIGGVITSMTVQTGGDLATLFNDVIGRLSGPISGMGTAFSASLFGLAGSLVLGFLDLQASQAQNAFYNDLEEWLSGITRLSAAEGPSLEGVGGAPIPAYVAAMLQQTADNLDRLQHLLTRSEENRGDLQAAVGTLSQRLAALSDRLAQDQDLTERLLAGQQEMLRQLAAQARAEVPHQPPPALDHATREHIRNTDVQLGRLIEEMTRGRHELSRELRNEIKLVARTIAIVAGEPEVVRD